MQYEAKTPADYVDQLEDDWRKEKLEQIRKMIRTHGPELVEGVAYKMLCYGNEKRNIFHLNVQRAYVSLYVGNIDKVEDARVLLNDFSMGKGCIRVKKSIHLPDTKLDAFISRTIDLWRNDGNTDC